VSTPSWPQNRTFEMLNHTSGPALLRQECAGS
jgi:hypothetical protein